VNTEERVACPFCKELILPDAIKCKECGSTLSKRGPAGQFSVGAFSWVRNQPNRKILGVAACIAYNLRVSATVVRLVFVLLTFVSFLGLILYLALAAVLPADPGTRSLFETAVDAIGAAFDSFHRRNVPVVTAAGTTMSGSESTNAPPPAAQLPPLTPPLPPEPTLPNS